MIEARKNLGKIMGPNGAQSSAPALMLVAFVDGVGFKSNMAGLEAVLNNADEFIQFATCWKLLVIAARVFGTAVDLWIPDPGKHEAFLHRCRHCARLLKHPGAICGRLAKAPPPRLAHAADRLVDLVTKNQTQAVEKFYGGT